MTTPRGVNRAPNRFKAGEISNPRGRPPIPLALKTSVPKCVDELIKLAFRARREAIKLRAIELILAYTLGKPKEQLDVNANVTGLMQLQAIVDRPPSETYEQWRERVTKQIAGNMTVNAVDTVISNQADPLATAIDITGQSIPSLPTNDRTE